MKHLLTRLVREDEGQDLIEYALLAAFLSLVAAGGAVMVGTSLDTWYQNVAWTINTRKSAP
jgi:Flp pilus assembly pilin Flp